MRTHQENKPRQPTLLTIYILAGGSNWSWLLASIESITSQVETLPIEVVVSVNSPSIDIEKLNNEVGGKAQIRNEQQRVPSEVHIWNCAVECRSPYIMLFHDDDILAPGYLKKALKLLKMQQPDLITTDMSFFSTQVPPSSIDNPRRRKDRSKMTKLTKGQLTYRMLRGDAINFASCIYQTKKLIQCDLTGIKRGYGKYSDRPLMLESAGEGGQIIHCTGNTVYTRVHQNQDSQQRDPKAEERRKALLNYYRNHLVSTKLGFRRYWTYACWRALHDCSPNIEWLRFAMTCTRPRSCDVTLVGCLYCLLKMSKENMLKVASKITG